MTVAEIQALTASIAERVQQRELLKATAESASHREKRRIRKECQRLKTLIRTETKRLRDLGDAPDVERVG